MQHTGIERTKMSDLIHLLPDSIANQIAAGEVVQRPSSVVKELIENAIDAEADSIQLIIKDAGRTLIQVIDNGKGMSPTDARMAFERHATSKIKTAEDLFALTTMGFRGEALPSIAAISQVELRTRQEGSETGTCLVISGSKVESQEVVGCAIGSNFAIKNIFFNVPARRKFLKSNDTERRHILTEFERIALVYPEIEFSFIENDIEALKYPAGNLRQRITNVMGKNFNQQLLAIEVDTSLVKISGFIGKPEAARKTRSQQFFFVNGRYMKNPYFHSAVMSAYEHLIPVGERPNYFIYLDIDPSTIDVNIHPTKTEVKFENEQPIWQIIFAAIKEALGKFNEIPSIDFDTADAIDIPIYDSSAPTVTPKVSVDPTYNPFKSGSSSGGAYKRPKMDWESFYDGFKSERKETDTFSDFDNKDTDLFTDSNETLTEVATESTLHYQYKNKYIITSAKSGLMLIDQRRAHIRILFDQFLSQIQNKKGVSQRMLFPEIVELSPSEASMIPYISDDLEALGFDLSHLGGNSYSINGIPSETSHIDPVKLVQSILSKSIDTGSDVKDEIRESLALSMAQSSAINYGDKLSEEEMLKIVSQLFASPQHSHTPTGKTIIAIMTDDSLDKMFR